jgi:hypothetical protein
MDQYQLFAAIKRFACCLTVLSLLIPLSSFAAPFDFGFKAGLEHFLWEEFEDDGSKLLDESGVRYMLSGFLGNTLRTNQNFIYHADAKLYFGDVDYDGQTQDRVPVTSDTNYTGFLVEGEVGYRAGNASGNFAWDIVARGGFDSWVRQIDNSRDVTGRAVRGITEQYTILNLRAGTGPYWQAGNWQGRFIAGFKLPLLTNEYISKEDSGFDDDVTLEPKGRVSPFLNFYSYVRLTDKLLFTIEAFYDSYRFDASDPEVVGVNGETILVWQPESSQDNYGLQGGVSFSF